VKIVFAGTPEFAVPSLAALITSRHEVRLVVTQPDRPAGRGRRAHSPPVKVEAMAHGIEVFQPDSINDPACLEKLGRIAPDAMVVVAYGERLCRRALGIPRLGCYNVHASLLPKYRGAAPVHHAILNGENETGVTIQRMEPGIDTGDILVQRAAYIYDDETTGELTERLAALAATLIVPAMDAVERGEATPRPQDSSRASLAPKLRKSDGWIRWSRTAREIFNFVRAMTPWPGAFTFYEPVDGSPRRRLIVLAVEVGPERRSVRRRAKPAPGIPGKVVICEGRLAVATGDGLLTLLRVHPEGGRAMSGEAYLRGHALREGDYFREPE